MTDNIYLRCSVIVLLCATTFAAPGGFGSFAGSSSSAFSSATSNAQAGSVASAISSAFSGGVFPSNNPDGLNHLQGISVGSGSFAGTGNIHPGSDKIGLSHQISSGVKGGHNNHKSQSPCSQCAHTKEKLDYENYDEEPEEKDEETHGEEDDCDDGQYRPEHHYKHDKSGDGKDNEEETVPGVHKIGNSDQYNYDQENDKGAYTPSGNKGQGNNNYVNTGLTAANNQNKNNNYGDYQHSTKYPFAHTNAGASKDFSHLSINPSDFNKKKEHDNKNLGTPGVVAPTSGAGSNYGNTNKGPFGSITPSQTNLGSGSGTNAGCSKTGSGGGCSTSETDSNLNQGPVKIGQTHLTQATNAPSFTTGENKGTAGCNSLYGNCGNGKTDGTGQYQSTSVGSGQNLQSGYTGGVSGGNKPQSYDQQHTGQPNKGNLPSGPGGNVGVGSGCSPGSPSSGCSNEGTPLQKNIPVSTQTYGNVGSGPGHVGVGSKPIPTQLYGTGSGSVGVGNTPFPTQTHGTFGSGSGNIGFGNKPNSYDQQHTGQPNKGNLPSGPGGNVGVGSGCGLGSSSPGCSNQGAPLQKNTPIPSQTYGVGGSGPGHVGIGSTPFPSQTHGTFGSGSGNVGLGNKPHSYDQQHTGIPSKGNVPTGPGGNVGVGSGCSPGSPSSGCSNEGTPLQKNIPIPTQTYGNVGSGPGHVGVGSKPIPTQLYGTGSGSVGVGSTPFPTQTHGTFGTGSGNIGFGNKPNSNDQQHTGQPNKGNLPSGPGGNVGVGSGCGLGSSSPGCSNQGAPLQKNTPIPSQTYGVSGSGPGHVGVGSTPFPSQTHGTFGSGSGNVGLGNKPHSYDQQHTGIPSKGNVPTGPGGNVGVGSGCGSGSPGCSNEGTPLQKNTPIPSQTYGVAGSGPGQVGVGSKPIPTQLYGTGSTNVGVGSPSFPTQTHGTFGSGSGNVGLGNKPHSYDQQHTGIPSKGNLPSGPGGNVGVGSGCSPGSSGCSNEGTPLEKNTPIPTQTYGNVGSGPSHVGVGSKPIPTQLYGTGSSNVGVGSTPFPSQTHGTFGIGSGNIGFGNKPNSYDQQHTGQPNKGNLPSGPGGNVNVGSGCSPGSSGCSNEGTPLQKNTPIPSQTYGVAGSGPGHVGIGSTPFPSQTHGTFGSGSGNVGLGNKPHSYDQQHTGIPSKGNLPSGPGGNVGVGSGCSPGSSGCSNEGTPLQKNTPIPTQTYGNVGSGPGHVGVGSKPIPTQLYGTGSSSVGVGSTPFPSQTHGTFGSGSGNIGFGNKPNSYDQQHTGQPNKGNLPTGSGSNVGVGSGCGVGSPSSGCSNEGTPLQKNIPIPSQTYGVAGSGPGHVGIGSTPLPTQTHGTFGSGSGNIGFGNKPNSYDQSNKGNLPSGPGGNVGVGSGCGPGSSSSGCSNQGAPLQKNTPIPSQTYGVSGSGPVYVGVGSTPFPSQTHGTFGSGSGNVGLGNKPHSYDQQHTGIPSKGNLPSGPGGGIVGVGSGCGPGSPSSGCSNEGTPLQKNIPIPTQSYGNVGSGPGHVGIGSTPLPTQTHGTFGSGSGNIGFGNKPNSYDQQYTGQPNKGNLPSGSSGTVGAGSGSKPGVPSAPCDDEGTPLQKNVPISSQAFGTAGSGSGFNANGQSGFGNQNSYQFNTGNPFLHGGQINSNPNVYPTSSPFSNSLSTTVKPIGHGNPFLDGTITNTFGSQHVNNDKHSLGVIPIKNDVPNKPIGVGNPFLSNGSGGSPTFGTAIHPGINIGNISPSTVKPIGQNNPFFGTSSGNSINKYPSGVDSNKNTPFGSGTSNPSSTEDQNSNIQFPKSKQIPGVPGVIGISSSGTYSNTNQGVKGGQHHNPTFGSVATSSAGAFSSGFNTPNAYNNNNNNAGHGTGSLIGTANIKKPSYTLLNSPGTSSQTSGSGNSANGNGNSLSNSLNNGNNPNGQFNHQIANAGAQSFASASAGASADASAGSYAGSFSSSQASSSSSSFASSKSGSYSVNGDPNILHQLQGNWPPFNGARSLDGTNSGWPSLNAGSQASAFASSSAGSWSGSQPFGVKSR
ncbi:hornerin-like [Polistes fuscatus]|uniref:hornerin-like n=1 Tax=Polistes fuscatus TaxID=30207 RepID=UPI001CA84EF1|nr:hornerin-like [Polistes fuscatus]